MRNIKLTLAYDGTDFHGWQVQARHPTIQGALTAMVRKITQERLTIHGASRTDAGVHALGQVAHFKTRSGLTALEFQRALNALLPSSIRVLAAEEVGPDFHARWQAAAKTYLYRIVRGRVLSPFDWRYALHYPWPLDEAAMSQAARLFEGEHDFTSFAASSGAEDDDRERNPLRVLVHSQLLNCSTSGQSVGTGFSGPQSESPPPLPLTLAALSLHLQTGTPPAFSPDLPPPGSITRHPSLATELLYVVRGRSFLRYMVRKIVGTLIDVGKGKLAVEDIPRLFALRDRSKSGATMPPQGLFLVSVEYPDPWREP